MRIDYDGDCKVATDTSEKALLEILDNIGSCQSGITILNEGNSRKFRKELPTHIWIALHAMSKLASMIGIWMTEND